MSVEDSLVDEHLIKQLSNALSKVSYSAINYALQNGFKIQKKIKYKYIVRTQMRQKTKIQLH
jgi:hypothetical protein